MPQPTTRILITKKPYSIKGTPVKKEKRTQHYHVLKGNKPKSPSGREVLKRDGHRVYAKRDRQGKFTDIQDIGRASRQDQLTPHRYKTGADRRTPKQYYESEKSKGLTDTMMLKDLNLELDMVKTSDLDPRKKKSWIRRILDRIGFVKSQQKIKTGPHITKKGIASPIVIVPEKMSPQEFNKRLDRQGLTKLQKIRAIEESQQVGKDILKGGKGASLDPVTGKIGKMRDLTEFEKKQIRLDNQKLGRYKSYIQNKT